MSYEHGVEEWLPGGVVVRAPSAGEVSSADFTLNGRLAPSESRGADRATFDLNEIDFEGLIALGISVGQAARFISQRERRGGIQAVSEIDGFYGIAPGVRDILRWSGHV